jgi:hypothetical protein
MSKILKPNETGFGIIIEEAEFITPDLNQNLLNENFELKSTEFKPNEPILVKCILQKWGVKNKNGRIYPKSVLIPQVEAYQELVRTNSAVSECFTPDTKIMTKEGWKLIKNISDDEEILTLNRETKKTEYQKITKKINDEYSGDLYHIKSNAIDIKVTPNHRFIIENNKNELMEITASELFECPDYSMFFNGTYKLLKKFDYDYSNNQKFVFDGVEIKDEDFYAFMGIYLSEGWVKPNSNIIYISQKKKENIDKINQLIINCKLNFNIETKTNDCVNFSIHNKELNRYLFPLGKAHQKYIPVELKNNSPHLLKILLDWFLLGDGRSVTYKERNGKFINRKSVFTVSKKLIYDLNEIQLKSGGSGIITIDTKRKDRTIIDKKNVDGEEIINERAILRINSKALFNLNFSKSKHIYLDRRSIKIKKIKYSGNVVCVQVPNETIYVMRNGKSLWTLNSDHPEQSIISLQNISHMITKMWWGNGEEENVLFGEIKLIISLGYIKYGIASVIGDKILLYLQNKIRLGISSRGVGTLKEINGENVVQGDFELIGFDLVATPSTPGAYLFPINNNHSGKVENKPDGTFIKETKIVNAINKFLI